MNFPSAWRNFPEGLGCSGGRSRGGEHRYRRNQNDKGLLNYSPELYTRKYVIVHDCERMTQQAASAFLKTLEEPPEYAVIVLNTRHWHYLLPTIKSRVFRVVVNVPKEFRDLVKEKIGDFWEELPLLERLQNGFRSLQTWCGKTFWIDGKSQSFGDGKTLKESPFRRTRGLSRVGSFWRDFQRWNRRNSLRF